MAIRLYVPANREESGSLEYGFGYWHCFDTINAGGIAGVDLAFAEAQQRTLSEKAGSSLSVIKHWLKQRFVAMKRSLIVCVRLL